MPFASNQGINIYFEVHGETRDNSARDKPALVFAHGAGGNAASWWQQVPAFVSSHKVIVFDHRGFGRTVCAADAVDAGYFEEDLRAVLDAAAVDTACIVCQSMGGWTGVRAAVSFPERIRGVLLANTPGAVMCDEAAENLAELPARIAAAGGLMDRAISQQFVERSPLNAFLYQQIAAFNSGLRPDISNPEIYMTPQQCAASGVPFWVVASDLDPLFPEPLLRAVAGHLGATLRAVKGAGHSTYFEMPEVFNSIVDEFLQAVVTPG